jgi:hypothetical protein
MIMWLRIVLYTGPRRLEQLTAYALSILFSVEKEHNNSKKLFVIDPGIELDFEQLRLGAINCSLMQSAYWPCCFPHDCS